MVTVSSPAAPVGRRHLSLREAVVQELRERILTRALLPGQRLVERDLSTQLEVSRIPLREAILQLEAEGLVFVRPRRGAFVASFPEQELEDFFAIREALEPVAARLATARATSVDLEAMRRHLDAETSALKRGDVEALDTASTAIHTAIAEAADSSLLVSVMRPLGIRARWQVGLQRVLDLHAIRDEHAQLYEAIANGEAEAAAQISVRHAVANRLATLAAIRQHTT
jgi:DNA-binding GntR family transcriptional regulator